MSLEFLIKNYQERFENLLPSAIEAMGSPGKLRDACTYALNSGGKRFRPLLVFMISDALEGKNVSHAALAVEFFHTASLIADDLPCMDNDSIRRGRPATHVIFGEATALLASYALIASGYEEIAKAALQSNLNPSVGILALKNASQNTGLNGATGGQFLDLFPPDASWETASKILNLKTVALFEISFVFGWLFGGGAEGQIERIKKAAFHFGLAFQLADDLKDFYEDAAQGRLINGGRILGIEEARHQVSKELRKFWDILEELKIANSSFKVLRESFDCT